MAFASIVFMLTLLAVSVRCAEIQECVSETGLPARCIPLTNCPEINKIANLKPMYLSDKQKIEAVAGACGCSLESPNLLVCCESPDHVTEHPPPKGLPSTAIPTSTSPMPNNHNPYFIITTTRTTDQQIPHLSPTTTTTAFPTPKPKLPTECGRRPPTNQIISEVEDSDHVHTWAVLLEISESKNKTERCVGTIITDRLVLTAAHCIYHVKLDDLALYYGLIARSELQSCLNDQSCQERKAAEFIIHEGYNEYPKLNDIALIRVEDPVVTSDYINPICLPLNHTVDESTNNSVISVGWGMTFGEELSDTKRVVRLQLIPQEECAKSLRFNTTVLSSMMCTLGSQPGQDVCDGDSGAPLLQLYQHLMYVVGVVSYGPPCGMSTDVPGKAMRVSHYLNWILTKVKRSEV